MKNAYLFYFYRRSTNISLGKKKKKKKNETQKVLWLNFYKEHSWILRGKNHGQVQGVRK